MSFEYARYNSARQGGAKRDTRVVGPWSRHAVQRGSGHGRDPARGHGRRLPAPAPPWEAANPIRPLPEAPLGPDVNLAALPDPPTPARVRLGRWLFYDTRLSADGTVACATCHQPEHAFSQPTAVSTGVGGQKGRRKAPSFVNDAVSLYPHFFWDGRADSLEEQALGPMENPIEMGNTHEQMIETLIGIPGYRPYFAEAFGSDEITQGARGQGDCRLRAHADERQLALRPVAAAARRGGRVRRREARARSVLRQGRLRPVSCRQPLHRQHVPQHRHRLGRGHEDVLRRGALRSHHGSTPTAARSRRRRCAT